MNVKGEVYGRYGRSNGEFSSASSGTRFRGHRLPLENGEMLRTGSSER